MGILMRSTASTSTDDLWDELWSLVTDVSVGELEKTALKMLSNFRTNGDGDKSLGNDLINNEFISKTLNEEVEKHDSTITFCAKIQAGIQRRLAGGEGNPVHLKDSSVHNTSDRFGRPHFSTSKDIFLGGLTTCINDTWAYEVFITEFSSNDGKNFKVVYKVVLYDHFGLDKPDVDPQEHPLYYAIPGFRAWFVLQHLRNFKPFITRVEFERSFVGNVSSG
ncbi:MAG: DUF3289 family protein [Chloracidobacterium sp.]|nr:DUF3289 family protein [Chloracidobacterium sp.]